MRGENEERWGRKGGGKERGKERREGGTERGNGGIVGDENM